MKKILSLYLVVCLMFISIPVFADQSWPIKSKLLTASSINDSTLVAGVLIYGVKCIATADSAQVALFDSTTNDQDTDDIIDEASAATSGNDSFDPLVEPIKVVNGTTVALVNAHAIVYYRD